MKLKDLTGMRFGSLMVLRLCESRALHGQTRWLVRCDCGVKKEVLSWALLKGKGATKSCGCMKSEYMSKAFTIHGMRRTNTYCSWACMKKRCARDKGYIQQGITFDHRWKTFINFLNDMGEAPNGYSLDRIDPFKSYSKENCRWVTKEQQANNKRNTNIIIYRGQGKSMSQWARDLGIALMTLKYRIRKGWSIQRAFNEKPKTNGTKKVKHFKHNMYRTRIYSIWKGMRNRCRVNTDYTRHNITIDPRWDDFLVFYAEMGEPPEGTSLERIDFNKGYNRDNCRWATEQEQQNNKRSNVFLTRDGKRMTITAWERELGFRRGVIASRLRDGWSIERALSIRLKS
jgi:hypothetical protein